MSEKPLWWTDVESVVYDAAHGFSNQLCEKLLKQCEKPKNIVARKNPFLYRIRGADTASKYASMCVEAFVSSSEETIFGAIFERCAEVIAKHGRGAKKSGIEGIDLEWDDDGIRVLAQIKSSVNWGNSSQKKQLKANFGKATRILKQGTSFQVRCLECCSYGKSSHKVYDTHERIVGALFWQEISGWNNVYSTLNSQHRYQIT